MSITLQRKHNREPARQAHLRPVADDRRVGQQASREPIVGPWRNEVAVHHQDALPLGPVAHRLYLAGKRAFDIVASAGALLALLPLLLVVALAIRLTSPGPILFRQNRIGQHGRPFQMLKFRTMRPDRRRRAQSLPQGQEDRRRVHKSVRDPRVTDLGRFLRRSSIDELPQLWNVLVGDMSLVGPRPELPHIVDRYEAWQHRRHAVKPGITGWWQINRDGTRLMHEATELDIYYVDNQSPRLDLIILLRTVGAVLRGAGAF